jgi:hypothetical protein
MPAYTCAVFVLWLCHSFAFRVGGGNSSVAQGAPSEKDSQVLMQTTTKAQAAFSQAALFFATARPWCGSGG